MATVLICDRCKVQYDSEQDAFKSVFVSTDTTDVALVRARETFNYPLALADLCAVCRDILTQFLNPTAEEVTDGMQQLPIPATQGMSQPA